MISPCPESLEEASKVIILEKNISTENLLEPHIYSMFYNLLCDVGVIGYSSPANE